MRKFLHKYLCKFARTQVLANLHKCASTLVLAQVCKYLRKYASICASSCTIAQVLMQYVSAQLRKCASTCASAHILAQVCKCTDTQVRKYLRKCPNTQVLAQVHKYARVRKCTTTCPSAPASTCISSKV